MVKGITKVIEEYGFGVLAGVVMAAVSVGYTINEVVNLRADHARLERELEVRTNDWKNATWTQREAAQNSQIVNMQLDQLRAEMVEIKAILRGVQPPQGQRK